MSNSPAVLNNKTMTLFESVTSDNPKSMPSRITREEYDSLDNDGKANVNNTYGERKWKAQLHNRDGFLWLWDVYKTEEDPVKKHALEVKMTQFKAAIQRTSDLFPALALDWNKYPFNAKEEKVTWDD